MSAGFLLCRRLEFRAGLGRVEAREVLLLLMKRLSLENISSGSFSLTMARSPARSGEGSFDFDFFLADTGQKWTGKRVKRHDQLAVCLS